MNISPTVVLSRRVPGLSERALSAFVRDACRAAGLKGAPTVLVTSSRRMRQLNAKFRGKDYATDVLSFPSPTFVEGFAGDIAVSADIAARNARALSHSVANEIEILVLHGVLHLAGYDHESDNGKMAGKEIRLRRKLGLPAALIERAVVKHRTAKTQTRR
jgi:probable rRNA maturation factor